MGVRFSPGPQQHKTARQLAGCFMLHMIRRIELRNARRHSVGARIIAHEIPCLPAGRSPGPLKHHVVEYQYDKSTIWRLHRKTISTRVTHCATADEASRKNEALEEGAVVFVRANHNMHYYFSDATKNFEYHYRGHSSNKRC